jgi:NAD(P)-dependent dehydrogenase (short-subunit alcohol dehydrogenase family)
MEHQKTIFITGASSGIGKEAAKLFHKQKWNVIATMRNPDKEEELKQLDNVLVLRLDVTDTALIDTAIAAGLERFGRIDALLNNAGFGIYGPLEATPIERIRQQFETNVIGLLQTTKGLLSVFRAQRAGLILNVSSIGGIITYPLGTLYHGSKFAVEGLSESMTFEMREIGVTVKLIEPGDTLTDFKIEMMNDESLPEYQRIIHKLSEGYAPIKAKGSQPSEIAEVIYRAATDGTDQLRYPAGHDAIAKVAKRKSEDDATFLQDMRAQFSID